MKDAPRIGEVGQLEFTVTEQHIIDFADDKMPAILSTPWLIWFLEHAAREAMLPHLEPAESTVGTQVDVQHLAATPLGARVICKARIIYCDKTQVTFQLDAHDGYETIARGLHKLRVIDSARLAEHLRVKSRSN